MTKESETLNETVPDSSLKSIEDDVPKDTLHIAEKLKKKDSLIENDGSHDDKDQNLDDKDSSVENDQNRQNEGTPNEIKSEKVSPGRKRKSDESEKKVALSSPKKKKSSEFKVEVETKHEDSNEDEVTQEDENSTEKDAIKNNKKSKKKATKFPKKKEKASESMEVDEPNIDNDNNAEAIQEKKSDNEIESSSTKNTISKKEDLTVYFEKRDHSVNQVYQSEVPQICKDEPCQLGVDEAGRGPVLGPMVYGISYAPLSQKKLLVDLGCADSKSLTEDKRDAIFDKMCNNSDKMGWAVDAISPNYIANCMYRRSKTSLNEISMNSAIDLIKKTIEAGVFVSEIYVDTVGKPEKYQLKLELIFPGIKITVAKKADSTYPIVSAASICAKVSRDHALRAWQFREGENESSYGSGYPNDPVTKTWLADNVDMIFGFPQLVRFSWSTAEKILESKALMVEWEEPEEDAPPVTGVKISSFFSASPSKKSEKKRHKFFTNRCLTSTTTL